MRIDPRTWPITIKIGLAISLTVFAGTLIAGLLVQNAIQRAQIDIIQEDFQSLSDAQLERIVEIMTREISILVSLAHEETLLRAAERGGGMEVSGHLNSFVDTFPQFQAVVLTDYNGQAIGSSYTTGAFNLQGMSWWRFAYAGGEGIVYVSNPMTDTSSGATGVQIAVPLRDDAEDLLGIVMAVWDFDLARETLISGTPRHTMVLDSREQRVLADTASEEIEAIQLPDQVTERLFTELNGALLGPDEQGISTIYGYASLTSWPREIQIGDVEVSSSLRNLGWLVVVREPTEEAVSGIIPLIRQLQALIAVSAAIAIMFAIVILRGTMAPLHRLTMIASDISAGNFDTPVPDLPRDEVGQLAGVLREMVSKLTRRQEQLAAAARISRATMFSLDIEQMLSDALNSLSRWFEYTEARVYLIESTGRQARLRAAVGEESERLLSQRHQLEVNESTLVGRSILLDEPQVVDKKTTFRGVWREADNPQVAIPLRAIDRPLGALYLATDKLTTFEPGDVEVLRLVADQLSGSLENVRLYEQSQAALVEIEALNRRLTHAVWEERLTGSGHLRHTLDPDEQWPESLKEVRRRADSAAESYADGDGRSVLAAPIILRGESIGTIGVTRPPGYRWSADEAALVEAVAARVAMIAESIRLVDESARIAQREQIISSVSERLQRAVDVDTVVMTALDQLGDALGTGQVSLRIGPPPVDSDRRLTSAHQDGDEDDAEVSDVE